MLEITRRTFVEGKGILAEEQDWKSRELGVDVRGWSAYCVFVTAGTADKLQDEVRKKIPRAYISAIESQRPDGVWLRGARWELELAIKELKLDPA